MKLSFLLLLLPTICGYSQSRYISPYTMLGKHSVDIMWTLQTDLFSHTIHKVVNVTRESDPSWDYSIVLTATSTDYRAISFTAIIKNDTCKRVDIYLSDKFLKEAIEKTDFTAFKILTPHKTWIKKYNNKKYLINLSFNTDKGSYYLSFIEWN